MHYGSNNKNYEYSLNSNKLTKSHQEPDLGVIFSKDLKNSDCSCNKKDKIMHLVQLKNHSNVAIRSSKASLRVCSPSLESMF